MISKEKFLVTYMVLYFLMVLMVSYTAMNSPFMADNYTFLILINSFILWASSFYLIGFKQVKAWWTTMWNAAKKRSEIRQEVEDGIKKRGY